MKLFNERHVDLPTSREELEAFINNLIGLFCLPNTDQTRGMICQEIMHMGRTVSKAPLSIFAAAVKKQLANDAAYPMIEELRAKLKAEAVAKQVETAPEVSTNEQPVPNPKV